jgi:hypothetical protein
MNPSGRQQFFETVLVVVAPPSLAVLELFHPQLHDLLRLHTHAWLFVHYLQLPLFPLAAPAVTTFARKSSGFLVALCRVAMFVFAVSYIAFDTAAGVATGILVTGAQSTGTPEAWQAPILSIWTHPIVGGSLDTTPLLAALGTVAWFVGLVAATFIVRRAGSSWGPVSLLVVSALGLFVFKTHAWPGGPITFGALAVAAAWLQWGRAAGAKALANHTVGQ